ncbi:unnamed protein product, partial [Symbiodinium necroappetens]
TGEVLNPETLKRQTSQASEQNHSPQGDGSDVQESATRTATAAKVKAFDARARAEFRATAALASSRLRSMKLRPDHSTFSALNVDTLPSKPKSSPLASTCEGGNILLRPCRPIKEKPTSRISRPLPEVPGFPFDKVPASTAQMLAVLSLEPGLGKASKSSKAAKVRSAAPAPKPWQLEAREAPPKPSYTARSSDFEPSSTSGEAKPKKDAEADASTSQTHLKKDSDEDGKAQSKRSLSPAERSTSAASQEGPPVSQKTRWADVVSDDEECPWQTQAKSSEEEITQERSFASPGSFSKTRWADVDSDDDQLLPSGEEEDEESSSSPAEPAERQVRVRGEARRCQVKAEEAKADASTSKDKKSASSDEEDVKALSEANEEQVSPKTRWADVQSDDDQLLPSAEDDTEKDDASEEAGEWQEVKRQTKPKVPKAFKPEGRRHHEERPRERRDDRRRKDTTSKEGDTQPPRRRRDGRRNPRDNDWKRTGGGESQQRRVR